VSQSEWVTNVKYALAALWTSDTLSSCHKHPSPAYFLGPTIRVALHFSGFVWPRPRLKPNRSCPCAIPSFKAFASFQNDFPCICLTFPYLLLISMNDIN
jgi:hypothetical protein